MRGMSWHRDEPFLASRGLYLGERPHELEAAGFTRDLVFSQVRKEFAEMK